MTMAHGSGVRRSCSPSRSGFSVTVATLAANDPTAASLRPASCVCELAPLCADAVEELGEGVGELLHALPLERLDDRVVVDAGAREVVEELPRGLDILR